MAHCWVLLTAYHCCVLLHHVFVPAGIQACRVASSHRLGRLPLAAPVYAGLPPKHDLPLLHESAVPRLVAHEEE
jgi:hypothetical protein